jgi:hypothetical protein
MRQVVMYFSEISLEYRNFQFKQNVMYNYKTYKGYSHGKWYEIYAKGADSYEILT